MKKLLCMTITASIAVSCGAAVMAADKTPAVYVNTSEIMFEDQAPVILGEGTTLVPARGVFEAMGAKVNWDGDTRVVEVESADHKTLVRLTIDDSTMKVYDLSDMIGTLLSGQDFNAPETPVTLEVAPQIMNERTMIPLRAISEALSADVKWNGEAYTIDITTADAPASSEGLPALSLSSAATEVKEGETIDLYINSSNIPEGTFVSGVSATVKYNKENFEFVEAVLVNGDTVIDGALGASNPDFNNDYVKAAFVTVDAETAVKGDGAVMKLTFKSLNGGEGVFTLSNSYDTKVGYNTSLIVDTPVSEDGTTNPSDFYGSNLFVNPVEVYVNRTEPTEPAE